MRPQQAARPARWPRLLPKGGTIGICSPAGPSSQAALDAAANALQARGYRVVIAPNAHLQNDGIDRAYLAGSDDSRTSDLNGFFADPDIDLILCARGGYGSAKLLNKLNWAAFSGDPKPLVGYSDITALSLGLLAQTNTVSFSGIMATSGHAFGEDTLHKESEVSFWQTVGNDAASEPFPRVLVNPKENAPWRVWRTPASGTDTVSGPLIPVCLSLLISLLGTPYVPDFSGALLVIEDVHEDLYALDRALTQLRLAGILDNLAGVLIGSFNGTPEQDALLINAVPRLVLDMTPATVAVASGIAYGHIPCRLTLPVGATATANFTQSAFTLDGPIDTPQNP